MYDVVSPHFCGDGEQRRHNLRHLFAGHTRLALVANG